MTARTIRGGFIIVTLLFAALLVIQLTPRAQDGPYDVLIRGGRIVDGTGNPWFNGDVAIAGGQIAAVGRLGNVTATRIIDATGLVVAPGFIDLHTHSDIPLLADGTAQSKVRQGVTLDVHRRELVGRAARRTPRRRRRRASLRTGQPSLATSGGSNARASR